MHVIICAFAQALGDGDGEREGERERYNYMYIRSLFCCNAQEFASRLADAVLRWCAAEQQQRALLLQSLLCR